MQSMWIGERVVTSLRHRGLSRSVQTVLSIVEDWWFDRRHGTETAQWTALSRLQIVSDNKSRGVDYQPTRSRAFLNLMARLALPPGSVFVDLGCGKGRILLLASRFGIARAVGVEFSPELAALAHRNIQAFRRTQPSAPPMEVVTSDVVDYRFQDDESCLFMFNPFDASVLRRLLENVRASLARSPRPVWLIYHKPVWRDVVEASGLFELAQQYHYGSSEFTVYRTPSPS